MSLLSMKVVRGNRIKSKSRVLSANNVDRFKINLIRSIKYFVIAILVAFSVYIAFVYANILSIEYKGDGNITEYLSKSSVISDSTLVVLQSPVDDKLVGAWIVMRNNESGSLLVYYIPWWVYLYDYSGTSLSSRISVSNLEYTGELINQEDAKRYVLWQIMQNTGISINNYIWVSSDAINKYIDIYGDIADFNKHEYSKRYNEDISVESLVLDHILVEYKPMNHILRYSESIDFLKTLDTNMNIWQLNSFVNNTRRSIQIGGVNTIDVSRDIYVSEIYDKEIARNIPVMNTTNIDNKLIEKLSKLKSREYSSELSRTEVYNGSEISGLAFRYKRLLSNNGVNIIRFDNSPRIYERTTLYVTNDKFPITKNVILEILGEDIDIVYSNPNFVTTGDFVIILGENTADRITYE